MRTGCRCRNTFDSITSTRLRSLSTRPCRKIDVHACVSVSQFQKRVPTPSFGATVLVSAMSRLHERLGVGPLPELVLELPRLVHQDLSVVGQDDARALERPRRRTLEVDSREPEAAAVARTLELAFRREVVRCAPQMRA